MPTIYRKSMTLKDFLSQNDRFAANSGCLLKEVREGGAYFTLADIALAAVMNSRGTLTFGIENNIVFLHSAKTGDTLVAEAVEVYNHHKIPYVDVRITNQHGELCCVVTGMAYRKAADLPIDGLE